MVDSANTRYIGEGEIALNLPDKKLFSSNGSVLFEVGANLTLTSIGSNTFFANSTIIKINADDKLTFNDGTTQNTAFQVYDSTGVRLA